MIVFHHRIPKGRKLPVAASYRNNFYPAQFGKQALNLRNFNRNILCLQRLEKGVLGNSYGQSDPAAPVQPVQCYPAAHRFRFAISPCPVKPFTDFHRKSVPGNVRRRFYHRLNTVNNIHAKIFSANFHAVTLSSPYHCVQKKSYGTCSESPAGDMETVINGLLGLSAEGARSALNQSGGLTHTALAEAASFAFNRYLTVLSDRIRGFGATSPSLFAEQSLWASLDNIASDAGVTSPKEDRRGMWMKGYGSMGDRRDDDISSKYDYTTGGVAMGYDRKLENSFLLGVSAGYTAAKVDMDHLDDYARVSIYHASLYGSYQTASWHINSAVAYGYNRYDTSRDIVFGGINRTADADYDGHNISGYAEAGYDYDATISDDRTQHAGSLGLKYRW